jgi:hypothetical protein
MHPVPGITITGSNLRTRITIPAAGGRLGNLIAEAEPTLGVSVLTVLILGRLPSGVARPAFVVADPRLWQAITADDYDLRGQYVDAGEDYTSPSAGDLDSWLKAAADTPAIAVLFW